MHRQKGKYPAHSIGFAPPQKSEQGGPGFRQKEANPSNGPGSTAMLSRTQKASPASRASLPNPGLPSAARLAWPFRVDNSNRLQKQAIRRNRRASTDFQGDADLGSLSRVPDRFLVE